MISAAAIVLLLDLLALAGRGEGSALRWAGTLLAVAFYSLVIWCYLRRGSAHATTRSITARAAAVVATWIPFVIPWLHGAPPGAARQGVSDVLLLAGTAGAVWSLRSLGRNLSVIAQVRDVADGGRTGGSGTLCTPGRSCPRWGSPSPPTAWPPLPSGSGSVRCRLTGRCGRSSCCWRFCPGTALTGSGPRRSCPGSSDPSRRRSNQPGRSLPKCYRKGPAKGCRRTATTSLARPLSSRRSHRPVIRVSFLSAHCSSRRITHCDVVLGGNRPGPAAGHRSWLEP
jgi:hypothetical protein